MRIDLGDTAITVTAAEVLEFLGLAGLHADIRRILANQETLMANFDALNDALNRQADAIVALKDRIVADVQALRDEIAALRLDSDDQAKVDAATERLLESVAVLNGIDPVRPDEPADEPTPTPEQPTEPVG